jgi:cell division protein FtsW (lipid II flippase)
MILSDFWSLMDFAINTAVQVFTISDSVVIIDSPRFTLLSVMISILFLTLVMSFINWLRGAGEVTIWNRRVSWDNDPTGQGFQVSPEMMAIRDGHQFGDNLQISDEMMNYTKTPGTDVIVQGVKRYLRGK